MNYYSHHIGDFDRATRHLTRLERSIYRDLLDVYYDTEAPLTLDQAWLCRKIIARSNEEVTAVEQVLNEFFTKTPTGWYHERCEEELDAYRTSTSQKSIAGKASAAKRALKRHQALNGAATDVEQLNHGTPTNQEPRTNNQEPKSMSEPAASDAPIPPEHTEKRQRRRPSEDDYITARWMYGAQLKVNASAKQPNFDTWADEVRLMHEIDKRAHRDICELFQFAKNDSFWSANIQSPGKLRDKWDTLTELRARPAKQATASWWSSDAASIAKGAELSLTPLAGETIATFRARIQVAIDNGGKAPAPTGSRIAPPKPLEPKGAKPEGLDLKALLRSPREPA